MKITEGIKQTGYPFEIPDCLRSEFPEFFKSMGYKTGAEIGVYRGGFTKKFCEAGLKMYAIDPWTPFIHSGRMKNMEIESKSYQYAKETLASYLNCTMIKNFSMDAIKGFADKSLDFVYIDGDHDLKHVDEDILEWSKKVRKGGAISGHDLCMAGPAVKKYTELFGVKNWYILGKSLESKDPNDKHYSWINNPSNYRRAFRGLTSSAKHARMLGKGKGFEDRRSYAA